MGLLASLGKPLLDALFPPRCPLCGELITSAQDTCADCAEQVIRILPPVCERCGRPEEQCHCSGTPYSFARCVSPFVYISATREGIHRLKFNEGTSSAAYFAAAMAETVRREYASEPIDFVTCVPMHPIDQSRRGYNQSALLATRMAKRLGLPYCGKALVKPVLNSTQHTLSHEERSGNVLDVFTVGRPDLVSGSTVLLCDDVITTGNTLEQCTDALLASGAARVLCVTAAAVPGKDRSSAL